MKTLILLGLLFECSNGLMFCHARNSVGSTASELSANDIAPADFNRTVLDQTNRTDPVATGFGTRLRLDSSYHPQRLRFEMNQGQTDPGVKFLSRVAGSTVYLTETEAVILIEPKRNIVDPRAELLPVLDPATQQYWNAQEILNPESLRPASANRPPVPSCVSAFDDPVPHVLHMELVGANPHPHLVGVDELLGKVNYFIGNDPARWRTNIPTSGKVRFERVYPGIDLVFYGNEGQLEYDFLVAPGADPSKIKLAFRGADKAQISAQGDLMLSIGDTDIEWRRPKVYQQIGAERHEIACNYAIQSKRQQSVFVRGPQDETLLVAFALSNYDDSQPLTIDPIAVYSTYLGGGADRGAGITVDAQGNAYVCGSTRATDFPVTNAFQPQFIGDPHNGSDAFVSKFSPSGELLYSTFFGGIAPSPGNETFAQTIVVDATGVACLFGQTTATNFPVVKPLQPQNAGLRNAFVLKLNPGGNQLLYSTYMGGPSSVVTISGTTDSQGNAYVVGVTYGDGFPVTTNAVQPFFAGGESDGFLAKISPDGQQLVYATYLGGAGSGPDYINGIAVDQDGNAYLVGFTQSPDFPLVNAAQAGWNGWAAGFFSKLSADGSQLLFSSFYGETQQFASCRGVSFGLNGELDILASPGSGPPSSTNAPVYYLDPHGMVLVRVDAVKGSILSQSYIAGPTGSGVTDRDGNICFPSVKGVTVLSQDGSRRLDEISVGANANSLALDSVGNVYLTGSVSATNDFPVVNAFQGTLGGGFPGSNSGYTDAFVAKLSPIAIPVLVMKISGQELTLSWPAINTGFVLESANSLSSATTWTALTNVAAMVGGSNTVSLDLTAAAKFYRLRK